MNDCERLERCYYQNASGFYPGIKKVSNSDLQAWEQSAWERNLTDLAGTLMHEICVRARRAHAREDGDK